MKYVLIAVALIAFIVLVIVLIGYSLPVKHSATMKFSLTTSPGEVWQKLLDFKNYPEWRKKLVSVEVLSDSSWIETDQRKNRLPLSIVRQDSLKEMVTKIDGKDLPFGGSWIFTLQKQKHLTIVTITENGEVYNPVFRFVSRFIMGHNASIAQYGKDLESAFNKPK